MVRWLEKRGEEREVGRETDVLASLFSSYQIRGELHSISQLSGFSTSDRRDWRKETEQMLLCAIYGITGDLMVQPQPQHQV